ncbi:hypothetical protein DIPPA_20258 [Diplonema papillatum]|nr:hypothetical protein DIPPA_20258 [Diplonema papillatum]
MLRRAALSIAKRQQVAFYATEPAKPPQADQASKPAPSGGGGAAASTGSSAGAKPAASPSSSAPASPAGASSTPASASSAQAVPAAAVKAAPSMVPKAFKKPAPPTPPPTPPPSGSADASASQPSSDAKAQAAPVASSHATAEDIEKLLEKQRQLLVRMAQDIEVARGERAKVVTVNGDTPLRAIPDVLSQQAKEGAQKLGQTTKTAACGLQQLLKAKSYEAVHGVIGKRKLLTEMNRDQQLPWQKDSPKEMYQNAGKWLLSMQQGTEAPMYMTALECSVVMFVLLFWVFVSRRATRKARAVEQIMSDVASETDEGLRQLHSATEALTDSVSRKSEEIREVLSISNEQSITVEALSRSVSNAVAK